MGIFKNTISSYWKKSVDLPRWKKVTYQVVEL